MTPEPDPYFGEALWAARAIERQDGRFTVAPDQTGEQGKNNRVVRGFYEERPVIVKYYGDAWKPNVKASVRKGKELFCLTHYASSGVIPEVIAADWPDVIVMEQIPGVSLQALHGRRREQVNWDALLETISYAVGQAHGRLVRIGLPETAIRTFEHAFFDGQDLETRMNRVLAQAAALCDTVPELGSVERETIEAVRSKQNLVLEGARMVYKYDLNPANVLIHEDTFRALIDFEQCYVGTEFVYLGAIFDCLNFLSWDALKAGYETQTGSRAASQNFETVVVMACYNNWIRTLGGANGDLARWLPKLRQRFAKYHALLGA